MPLTFFLSGRKDRDELDVLVLRAFDQPLVERCTLVAKMTSGLQRNDQGFLSAANSPHQKGLTLSRLMGQAWQLIGVWFVD